MHFRPGFLKPGVQLHNVRVTDVKEVGVGNPAEETFCHPDAQFKAKRSGTVKPCRLSVCALNLVWSFPSSSAFSTSTFCLPRGGRYDRLRGP